MCLFSCLNLTKLPPYDENTVLLTLVHSNGHAFLGLSGNLPIQSCQFEDVLLSKRRNVN